MQTAFAIGQGKECLSPRHGAHRAEARLPRRAGLAAGERRQGTRGHRPVAIRPLTRRRESRMIGALRLILNSDYF